MSISDKSIFPNMKTMVEVCKASGVNFALMCTHTVDMAITELHDANEISAGGKWKDGAYFTLTSDERDKVDERAEEICLSTRFLSLSSDKIFSASKQELKNELGKGRNNYPKTIPAVLNFLQFHKLTHTTSIQGKTPQLETAFTQDGDRGNPPQTDGKVPFADIGKTETVNTRSSTSGANAPRIPSVKTKGRNAMKRENLSSVPSTNSPTLWIHMNTMMCRLEILSVVTTVVMIK